MNPSRTAPKTPVAGQRRWPLSSTAGRIRILLLVLAILFSVAGARAVQIQVLDAASYAEAAADQLTVTRKLAAVRGQITDRNGEVLAVTENTIDLDAHPDVIAVNGRPGTKSDKDLATGALLPAIVAPVVAKYTNQPVADLQAKLADAKKPWVRLAEQVPADTYDKIRAELQSYEVTLPSSKARKHNLAWTVGRVSNPKRLYPGRTVASNVLGYLSTGPDAQGVAGLEKLYEKQLAGVPGKEMYENSRNGKIPLGNQTLTPAVNGSDVRTTIDSSLCWSAQKLLDAQRDRMKLDWGTTVVMEVKSGKLLCLANSPSFDGNATGQADPKALGNNAIMAPYEPGSTMKVLTLAALIDAGKITPETRIKIGPKIKSGDFEIGDAFKHGNLDINARGVLVYSSNVGTIALARQGFSRDKDAYVAYLESLGLGRKTGIELPSEDPGKLPADLIRNTGYALDSVSFGTSLQVNAVQLAAAVNGIVNDGMYVAPTVVESITTADGKVSTPERPAPHRVVSSATSKTMREMMEQMTVHYADSIGIDGYRTAAKTGTARMGNTGLVASIAGVAPTNDPQVLVYTMYYKSDRSGAGIGIAGPVYHDIMSLALQRYGVQPSPDAREHSTQLPLCYVNHAPKDKC